MVKTKIASYIEFGNKYPGFGGFLPWVAVDQNGVNPTWDWTDRVPALDNGQLFWAAYGLTQVLESNYP